MKKQKATLLLNGEIVEYNSNSEMYAAIDKLENGRKSYFYVVINRIQDV